MAEVRLGAASEPALRVETREELVFLLGQACEIEHGLLCEYLYAQFSLKRGADEGVSTEQLMRIQAWERVLIDITKQEMLHLALATNILSAIGAAPHFERPNFPILSRWYPSDVQIALLPFGEAALRHFIYLERPEGMALSDAPEFVTAGSPQWHDDDLEELSAVAEEWHTVGHLYRGIDAGLAQLSARLGDSALFIGPPEAQVTTQVFEWPELIAVTDLPSAHQAIEVIVEQGEGARGDWVNSHFGRFVGVLEDYLSLRTADPDFEPARAVLPVFLHPPPDVADAVLISDPLTRRVAALFNAVYEVIMQLQCRYFVHQDETPAELDTLARTVKHVMKWVMRDLGAVLTALPIGPEQPGHTAGPAFEVSRPALFFLPHRNAAWRILRERLQSLGETADRLAAEPGLSGLATLSKQLYGFAGDLNAHLEARTASTVS